MESQHLPRTTHTHAYIQPYREGGPFGCGSTLGVAMPILPNFYLAGSRRPNTLQRNSVRSVAPPCITRARYIKGHEVPVQERGPGGKGEYKRLLISVPYNILSRRIRRLLALAELNK